MNELGQKALDEGISTKSCPESLQYEKQRKADI